MDVPKCECGCGSQVSSGKHGWNRFVHGHHAKGRKKSDDEKRRIGEKNRKNMMRYMQENPDIARLRNEQMLEQHTPELTERRLRSTRATYANMSDADKQAFRDRTKKRWDDGQMTEAREKAAETFRQRSRDGEYDFTERNRKLSESITKKYVDGTWAFAKGKYVSTLSGNEFYYRSSWELQKMQELDADASVVDWWAEKISIPYEFEGAWHHYVPDFLVLRADSTTLIEVKPQALRDNEKNSAKRKAAQAYCKEKGWKFTEWEPDAYSVKHAEENCM